MSEQPIYEARGLSVYHLETTPARRNVVFVVGCWSAANAKHLCALLNANPFPEDRPKRYTAIEGVEESWIYDTHERTNVVLFHKEHPDGAAAAQAECDRLNALPDAER